MSMVNGWMPGSLWYVYLLHLLRETGTLNSDFTIMQFVKCEEYTIIFAVRNTPDEANVCI